MQTTRFSALVAKSGKPSMHLSWTPPAKDHALQQALSENRVVTIHQQARGSKKDYAVVGLEMAHDAQYLIFPRSLRAFKDHKIVGIQYDLLTDEVSVGPTPDAGGRGIKRSSGATKQAKVAKVIPFPREQENEPERKASIVPAPKAKVPVPKKAPPAPKPPRISPATKKILRQALTDLAAGYSSKAEQALHFLLAE